MYAGPSVYGSGRTWLSSVINFALIPMFFEGTDVSYEHLSIPSKKPFRVLMLAIAD
jgi:hypothetical protein